jgi:serine/threonine-protein kinase HipA
MTARQAIVRLDGNRVGVLTEEDRTVTFQYDAEWLSRADAKPVSLTLPLQDGPYVTRSLHPFFENLLPEGWLLEIATSKLKISKDDAFGLLIATCADCIGVVEVVTDDGVEDDADVDTLGAESHASQHAEGE